jgi:ketosteroid isomerase-like protein
MTDNLDLVRGLYAAFAAGDVQALLGSLSADVRWCEAEGFPLAAGNPYVGADTILAEVFQRLGDHWPEFRVEPAESVGSGDVVTMLGRYRGTSRTGRALDMQVAHMWWLRDGKVTRFQQLCDTAAAAASLVAPAGKPARARATKGRGRGKAVGKGKGKNPGKRAPVRAAKRPARRAAKQPARRRSARS